MNTSQTNSSITPVAEETADHARRFGGVERLYGAAALGRFKQAHVCVIGIGGVGSWVAEALARNAIGRLTLIDLDNVAESNTNRQIHALSDNFGKAKVTAMAERIHAINPSCRVDCIEEFVELDNLDAMLNRGYDYVVDAIDGVRQKTALLAWCAMHKLPTITCGGAGGQFDPTRIQVNDLSRTIQDPLLSKVRANLRREHGFTRDTKKKFGIEAVFSDEPLQYPEAGQACEVAATESATEPTAERARAQNLSCAGFGSSICVTASFGMAAAARVLRNLAIPTVVV